MTETRSASPLDRTVGRLSDQLQRDHECGDFGRALEGYAERARELERQVDALRLDAYGHKANSEHLRDQLVTALAEVEALRAERRIPAIFDPDTGRACVVERHDELQSPAFRNVWIVDVAPNAAAKAQPPTTTD